MILGTLPVHAVAPAATQSRPSDIEVVLARARASAGVASGAHTEHALVLEGRSYPFGAPADVTLTLGSATNVPFTGGVFSPRVWNGTMYYDVIPEPATLGLLLLGGLALLRRR